MIEKSAQKEMVQSSTTPPAEVRAGSRGLRLTTMAEMQAFAQAVVRSGLAPKGMERPEAVIIALQLGAELGLPPMASLQNIAVINGRPCVWGDAALAVCQGDSRFRDIEETFDPQTETATCSVWLRGRAQPVVRTFSRPDAQRAGLWGKPGPWQQYPQRMLQMRARAFALRDALPGALRGLYFAEEVQDYTRENGENDRAVKAPRLATSIDDVAQRCIGVADESSQGSETKTDAEECTEETCDQQEYADEDSGNQSAHRVTKRDIWDKIVAVYKRMGVSVEDLKNHVRNEHGFDSLLRTPMPYLQALLAKGMARERAWNALVDEANRQMGKEGADRFLGQWFDERGGDILKIDPGEIEDQLSMILDSTTQETEDV